MPGVAGTAQRQLTLLNTVAEEADENHRASTALVRELPGWLMDKVERLAEGPMLFAPLCHPVAEVEDMWGARTSNGRIWGHGGAWGDFPNEATSTAELPEATDAQRLRDRFCQNGRTVP
jgi:hypothetical protein